MLLWFVIAYWIISVGIGLYAATRVHNTKDFAIAGRHLPFYMVTATVFATWFGSETVLGIPATFLKEGLHGVVADPFGASMCLILVGLFFAAPLYRMNLLTIGDFYKKKYGRSVEVLTTIAIVISYLGWVGAQITALGLVFNVVSVGEISKLAGMWIGSGTILIYTFFGGMWAVAVTDFIQMIIIVIGMLFIGNEISGQVGGVGVVVASAAQAGKFDFWPTLDLKEIIAFAAAWVTMMFGSIPQQDVATGRISARAVVEDRKNSYLGIGNGREPVFYFCLRANVPCLFGYADRSKVGERPDRHRPANDFAEFGNATCATICSGDVFRRFAFRHKKLRLGDAAGSFGDFQRKHPQANAGTQAVRPQDAAYHAWRDGCVHYTGYSLCDELQGQHLQDGRECLPDYFSGGVHSAGGGCLLEAFYQSGCAGGDLLRLVGVACHPDFRA
jgi:hypothetical protein